MIKTKNIYYAAYLFTSNNVNYVGCELILDVGQKTGVLFSFAGATLEVEKNINEDYEQEKATVNIRKYLDELIFVRNLMYHEISKGTTERLKKERTGNKNDYRTSRRRQARPTI